MTKYHFLRSSLLKACRLLTITTLNTTLVTTLITLSLQLCVIAGTSPTGTRSPAELGLAGPFADRGEGTEHRSREKEPVGDLARLGDNDERLVRGEEAHCEDQAKVNQQMP